MAMEDRQLGDLNESEFTEDELTQIGNRFLELIAPSLQQGQATPQRTPMRQRPAMAQRGSADLPQPQQLKKFSAGMAPKIKSVLEGYTQRMSGARPPQQMTPPQFMQQRPQAPMGMQQPNIYNNLYGQQQMPQGPFQAFNPYMVG